jgi:hypothetical protein
VGQRRPTDFLGYSAVMFWYARPGATHNRPPLPEAAARPIMSLADIAAATARVKTKAVSSAGIEFELLKPTAMSSGLQAGPQRPAEVFKPKQWSGESHYFIAAKKPGDFAEFTLTEQFQPQTLILRVTTSYDFGVANIYVNGQIVAERLDLFSEAPTVKEINLGKHDPVDNRFILRYELVEPNPRSRGAKALMGLDNVMFKASDTVKGTRPIRVFVVAGQSNAAGHNHVRQYHDGRETFPATLREQPGILFWPASDTLPANSNSWTILRVEDVGSFGPEISFARDMEQQMPGATIAIVKCAAGGTGIARSVDYTDYIPALAGFNDKGRNWHPPTDGREAGTLYSALIANVRGATSALERDGKAWELAGFVWMQGEHEAGISRKMAEDYERLLGDFAGSVRKDLQAPALPFAIGQVNSHTWAYGDIARKCQLAFCRKDARTRLVETVDLPRVSSDAAHFTADGMLTLGSRFAKAMLTLVPVADE